MIFGTLNIYSPKRFELAAIKLRIRSVNITLGNQIWEHLSSFCCEPEYVAFNDDGPSIARHQQVLTSKIKLHRKVSGFIRRAATTYPIIIIRVFHHCVWSKLLDVANFAAHCASGDIHNICYLYIGKGDREKTRKEEVPIR